MDDVSEILSSLQTIVDKVSKNLSMLDIDDKTDTAEAILHLCKTYQILANTDWNND